MSNLSLILNGFLIALAPTNLFAAISGAFMGLIVGAMPGIGSLAGVALLLPLTFKMNPTTAIIMLAALYYSNMYGGSFSAILLNIPGDSPAVMTSLDGYPLSRSGKAGKALFTSVISSFIGGTVGVILLSLMGPVLSSVGVKFGPAELASLNLLALTSIGWLLGEKPLKGLQMTCLGILLALVGVDATLGQPRFTFGNINLLSGISFIPLVIGAFGFSQVLDLMSNRIDVSEIANKKLTLKESLLNKNEIKKVIPIAFRCGFLGNFIGILPGAGATSAAFLGYIFQKKMSKEPEMLGKGSIEGVAAAESSNNGAAMGSFAPLLTLGIPGSGTSAVLLGGLMMWGLRPGPLLFTENPDFVWGLIGSMYVGNIICLIIAIACIPFLINILKVPTSIMIPLISTVCLVGTYSVNNNMFDVYFMIVIGFISYIFRLTGYSVAPLLLAFVLTPGLESAVRRAYDIGGGSARIFIEKPISLALIILTIGFSLAPTITKLARRIKQKNKNIEEEINPI